MKTSAALISKRPRIRIRGLLLFEVSVAIAIISVGLVFIIRSFSTSLNALKSATKYYQAVLLLENKAWDLKILALNEEKLIENPSQEGDFSPPYQDFHWSIQKEPVKDIELIQVTLLVSWPQNKGRSAISITTYENAK